MGRVRYNGPAGRTRVGRLRVFPESGIPTEVQVYRTVNVSESPALGQAAISGRLHTLTDGQPIDIPFVYHDPAREHFCLVIPESARNRELTERAALLAQLIDEHDLDLPAYVRNFAVVYGPPGLLDYLQRDGREKNAREADLQAWADALREEDERLRERVQALEAREQAWQHGTGIVWQDGTETELELIEVLSLDGDQAHLMQAVLQLGTEEIDLQPLDEVEDLVDDGATVVFDQDRTPVVSGLFPRVGSALPIEFWPEPETEMAVLVDQGELWVFAQVAGAESEGFTDGYTDLRVEVQIAGDAPIVVLTILDERLGLTRRRDLVAARPADHAVLEILQRDHRATIVVCGPDYQLLRSFQLEATHTMAGNSHPFAIQEPGDGRIASVAKPGQGS